MPKRCNCGSITSSGDSAGVANIGMVDYNDTATTVTPIVLPAIGTWMELTNNILGIFTNTLFLPTGVSTLWNAVTNRFDWTDLNLGDLVDIRIDVEVTTLSNNTVVDIELEMGLGGSPYTIPLSSSKYFKTAGTYRIVETVGVYIGDDNTRLNPARIRAKADTLTNLIVHGWYCKIIKH